MNQCFKLLLIVLLLFFNALVSAQNTQTSVSADHFQLKVYIDENDLDFNYLRDEIDFVDFVNDPLAADVQIIIVEEQTGSGGSNYSIRFSGKTFKNIEGFTLNVPVISDETQHNIRELLTNSIIKGLMPFFNETTTSNKYKLKLEKSSATGSGNESLTDKWKNWVFRVTSSGGFNLEESKSGYNYTFRLTGDKVTDKIKLNNYLYFNNQVVNYNNLDYVYRYNYKYAFTKGVYSLSDHWSAGLTLFSIQSSYYNKQFSFAGLGAFEYNIFPWDESNEHILSIAYSIGYETMHFYKENYRGNRNENMPLHRLYVTGTNIQPWGKISVSLTGSEYLSDLSLYNISFSADLSFHIIKGLSLTMSAEALSIHDQIYIPKDTYSTEQIISGATKLPTSYELRGSVGITYQFGSIYNNIVNRRL